MLSVLDDSILAPEARNISLPPSVARQRQSDAGSPSANNVPDGLSGRIHPLIVNGAFAANKGEFASRLSPMPPDKILTLYGPPLSGTPANTGNEKNALETSKTAFVANFITSPFAAELTPACYRTAQGLGIHAINAIQFI